MNKEKIKDWTGRCHCCGEKRTSKQLTMNNGNACQFCVDKHMADYEANKKAGKHNSPVLWCQDCQSQFKIFDAKIKDPFKNFEDFLQAERVHETEPYKIRSLIPTRWKCNCKDKKPILSVGMDYTNWADGFIEKHNKEVKEYDKLKNE